METWDSGPVSLIDVATEAGVSGSDQIEPIAAFARTPKHYRKVDTKQRRTRMWANARRDGRPAE